MMDLQHGHTLLDVVKTVGEFSETDEELLATVTYLVNSGKVRLCGRLAGSKIDVPESNIPQLDIA